MEGSSSYMRVEPLMFDEVLNRVGPRIQKSDTNFRRALEPGARLARTPRAQRCGSAIEAPMLTMPNLCISQK